MPADGHIRLGPLAVEMLEGIDQHRLLSSIQLHALYTPDRSREWTRRQIRRLEQAGLAAAVRQPGGLKLLYLTPAGLAAAETAPRAEPRRKLITAQQAAGPLQRHTLAVNDVGVSLVQAARARGDEFGVLSWRHEIAHPIGPPPGRHRSEQLIADALVTYHCQTPDGRHQFIYRFLELDRNTMPVHALAEKIARYARLFHHTVRPTSAATSPVRFWETRYPVFPTVLLVLDGGTPEQLRRRRRIVLALCDEDRDLRYAPAVQVTVCLLSDLNASGPFSPIARMLGDPGRPVDWLGDVPPTKSDVAATVEGTGPSPSRQTSGGVSADSPEPATAGPGTEPWLWSEHHLQSKAQHQERPGSVAAPPARHREQSHPMQSNRSAGGR